jgi:hypothetical protein
MRLFLATSPSKNFFDLFKQANVENCLVSYNFIKDPYKLLKEMNGYVPKNFILDSGAFSVWANGKTIDIDAYARFAAELKDLLPPETNYYVVNLDVLPGKFGERPSKEQREESAQAGWNNMLYLESKGLKVIHVFHQHEDFGWLEKIAAHSDYIGVSPANDVSTKEKQMWLYKVYSIIKSNVKTHGFAVTSHNQLYNFPLFSSDSSSWTAPARFGRIPVFTDKFEMKTIEYKNKKDVIKYWDFIKQVGIDILASDDYHHRLLFAIKSFQLLGKRATYLWANRTPDKVIWKEDQDDANKQITNK